MVCWTRTRKASFALRTRSSLLTPPTRSHRVKSPSLGTGNKECTESYLYLLWRALIAANALYLYLRTLIGKEVALMAHLLCGFCDQVFGKLTPAAAASQFSSLMEVLCGALSAALDRGFIRVSSFQPTSTRHSTAGKCARMTSVLLSNRVSTQSSISCKIKKIQNNKRA